MDNHFGVMLDCSRNAVYTVEAIKKLVTYLSKMGYNTLMLYTEDTYEVEGEPYFGYLRGRYSKEEIKEIDNFCRSKNIELIPCIQTLAHLNAIFKWDRYRNINDISDILLIDNEETYELIEKMISSLSKSFTSRNIHIGMDEAYLVGFGKYLSEHGVCDKFELLHRHLDRVNNICEKYGFKPMMWSDMFFKFASGDYYVNDPDVIKKEYGKYVPNGVSLVYWDYYSTNKEKYDIMIKAHKNFGKPVWFAGGFWTWVGFAPKNGFSIDLSKKAIKSCEENGIENMVFTMWGDDGAECSAFSVLPSMFYISQIKKGILDEEKIKQNFKSLFGIEYDDYLLLDLPGINGDREVTNPEKYMLYNDYFLGFYDTIADTKQGKIYKKLSGKLGELSSNEDFGHLFDFEKTLCDVLALKNDIGIKTREYYQNNDKEKLNKLIPVYTKIEKQLKLLVDKQRKMWFAEKKPYGFEVQEARMGALILRTESCKNRLQKFINGEISIIDELEENLLMPSVRYEKGKSKNILNNSWNDSLINKSGW